jgi:hypothetical protein
VKGEKGKGKQNREGGKEKRRKHEEVRKKRSKPEWLLFFPPESITIGRVQKLQCHLFRLFQRQDLQNRREDRKAKTNREKGTKTQS